MKKIKRHTRFIGLKKKFCKSFGIWYREVWFGDKHYLNIGSKTKKRIIKKGHE